MLLRIWQGLKGEHTAAFRGDLDLRQLPRLVQWLFIAEPGREGGFTWRLAGTGITQFLGHEVTGSDLLAGWDRFERGVIGRSLAAVAQRHDCALLRLRYLSDRGEAAEAEMLALPMLARDRESTHVLGGLFPKTDTPLRPYQRLAPSQIGTARLLGEDDLSVSALGAQARRKFQVISGGLDDR